MKSNIIFKSPRDHSRFPNCDPEAEPSALLSGPEAGRKEQGFGFGPGLGLGWAWEEEIGLGQASAGSV